MINSELNIPQEEDMCHMKVISCSKNVDSNIIGTYYNNLMFNSLLYDVKLPNG